MNRVRPFAWGLVLCIAVIPLAFAPVFAQLSPSPATGPTVQQGPGGTEYLSGGGGDEERAAMAARQREFPFKVVMSGAGGEFVVADKLSVSTPQGELLAIRDAGPIVMIKLPPGQYNLEATWHGKTERRSVRLASSAQTLEWRLPG
jgi:hypothetical protein